MTEYVAFLRGINVGGQRVIKMTDLKQLFISLGVSNVHTYIQSGNVSFHSESIDSDYLKNGIESNIKKLFNYDVKVMVRRLSVIKNIIKNNPFKDLDIEPETKLYICFLEEIPIKRPPLPLLNQKEGLELFRIDDIEAYILS